MRDYIFYGGKSIADFETYITDAGIYAMPGRSFEKVPVPGRNGDVLIEDNKYLNVEHVYPAVIVDDFDKNYPALGAFLLSQKGYKRLSDSFNPDVYYLATFKALDSLKQKIMPKAGTFRIVFDRKPQRYLVSGDVVKTYTGDAVINNPTHFEALPFIRAYGTGTLTVGDVTVQITEADEYTDIDCEAQEAYKGTTNCNGNIVLTNGVFPSLKEGINNISMTVERLEITPRWWTL